MNPRCHCRLTSKIITQGHNTQLNPTDYSRFSLPYSDWFVVYRVQIPFDTNHPHVSMPNEFIYYKQHLLYTPNSNLSTTQLQFYCTKKLQKICSNNKLLTIFSQTLAYGEIFLRNMSALFEDSF